MSARTVPSSEIHGASVGFVGVAGRSLGSSERIGFTGARPRAIAQLKNLEMSPRQWRSVGAGGASSASSHFMISTFVSPRSGSVPNLGIT